MQQNANPDSVLEPGNEPTDDAPVSGVTADEQSPTDTNTPDETSGPRNRAHCYVCNEYTKVEIDPADSSDNYYEQNVSLVKCTQCEATMGHLVWWPSRDESYTGL